MADLLATLPRSVVANERSRDYPMVAGLDSSGPRTSHLRQVLESPWSKDKDSVPAQNDPCTCVRVYMGGGECVWVGGCLCTEDGSGRPWRMGYPLLPDAS